MLNHRHHLQYISDYENSSNSSGSIINNHNRNRSNDRGELHHDIDIRAVRRHLRHAISEQTQRGLINSAKWLGELLAGLVMHIFTEINSISCNGSGAGNRLSGDGPQSFDLCDTTPYMEDLLDMYEFAKSLFDSKEYMRCVHVLEPLLLQAEQQEQQKQRQIYNKCFFMRCYSLYLAGEKRREEEIIELHGKKLSHRLLSFDSPVFFLLIFSMQVHWNRWDREIMWRIDMCVHCTTILSNILGVEIWTRICCIYLGLWHVKWIC